MTAEWSRRRYFVESLQSATLEYVSNMKTPDEVRQAVANRFAAGPLLYNALNCRVDVEKG